MTILLNVSNSGNFIFSIIVPLQSPCCSRMFQYYWSLSVAPKVRFPSITQGPCVACVAYNFAQGIRNARNARNATPAGLRITFTQRTHATHASACACVKLYATQATQLAKRSRRKQLENFLNSTQATQRPANQERAT